MESKTKVISHDLIEERKKNKIMKKFPWAHGVVKHSILLGDLIYNPNVWVTRKTIRTTEPCKSHKYY